MSNVLAVEAAAQLPTTSRVQDVCFQYFTAGLGGSGPLHLFITNLGFGEPMVRFDRGQLRFYPALSGVLLRVKSTKTFLFPPLGTKRFDSRSIDRLSLVDPFQKLPL
jgi:hypothetical protein